jgi:hypothetical protein
MLKRSALPFLFVLSLAAAALAAGPAWSRNVRVFEVQLAKIEVPKGGGSVNLQLPQLRIYNAQGRRLLEVTGYNSAFSGTLTSLLKGHGQADPSRLLAPELDRVRTADGKPLGPLPQADFTVVKYWAQWCVPCHAQTRDLVKVFASHPAVRVNLLHVDADLQKLKPEIVYVPKKQG